MTDIVFEPIYIKNSTQNIKNSTQINEIKTDFVKPMHSFSDIFDPTLAYLLFAKKNNTCITIFAIIFFICQRGISLIAFSLATAGLILSDVFPNIFVQSRIPYIIASIIIIFGFNVIDIILAIIPSGISEFIDEQVTQKKINKRHILNIVTLVLKGVSFLAAFIMAKLIICSETIEGALFFKDGFVMVILIVVLELHAIKEIMMMYFQGQWLSEYGKIGGRYWIDHAVV